MRPLSAPLSVFADRVAQIMVNHLNRPDAPVSAPLDPNAPPPQPPAYTRAGSMVTVPFQPPGVPVASPLTGWEANAQTSLPRAGQRQQQQSLPKDTMTVLRWILFLPVGGFLIALAQVVVGTMAERLAFWVAAPLIFFFGALIAMASIIPCRIAPDPKVGATILLTLFALFEIFAFISFLPGASPFPVIARLYTDVVLVIGGFIGARMAEDTASR
jgi:hypothetical protein